MQVIGAKITKLWCK